MIAIARADYEGHFGAPTFQVLWSYTVTQIGVCDLKFWHLLLFHECWFCETGTSRWILRFAVIFYSCSECDRACACKYSKVHVTSQSFYSAYYKEHTNSYTVKTHELHTSTLWSELVTPSAVISGGYQMTVRRGCSCQSLSSVTCVWRNTRPHTSVFIHSLSE